MQFVPGSSFIWTLPFRKEQKFPLSRQKLYYFLKGNFQIIGYFKRPFVESFYCVGCLLLPKIILYNYGRVASLMFTGFDKKKNRIGNVNTNEVDIRTEKTARDRDTLYNHRRINPSRRHISLGEYTPNNRAAKLWRKNWENWKEKEKKFAIKDWYSQALFSTSIDN